jgi:phosphoglycolate phosphatase-like HAD superfamily hydrolase
VPPPIALFWDVDGTLLTTARAGVFALEAAVAELAGRPHSLQELRTSGLTDAEVAAASLRAAGVEPDEELVTRFLRTYERHLPGSLGRRDGSVLPGVREILADLRDRDGVESFLLTGNTEEGARAKLAHYGLSEFFATGAFCVDSGARASIAHRALDLAGDAETAYVIGDTPHDVAAGHAIGARTIAVATGTYDAGALEAAGAWRVLGHLPPPPEFRALIGLADPPLG